MNENEKEEENNNREDIGCWLRLIGSVNHFLVFLIFIFVESKGRRFDFDLWTAEDEDAVRSILAWPNPKTKAANCN